MLLVSFHLNNGSLQFFNSILKSGIFIYFCLKFGSQFLNGIFEEFHSELILAFELKVDNLPDGDFDQLIVYGDKFIIFHGESFLDSVECEKRI